MDSIDKIKREIINHPQNSEMRALGYQPIFTAHANARMVIIGQAPGRRAQEGNKPWADKSGEQLRRWLGVDAEDFYHPEKISLLPMDFYFPGKGKTGDLPPRTGFAELWHPPLLALLHKVKLTILIGQYAQAYYLKDKPSTLTATVKNYKDYLPDYFPLPHPSPRNNIWKKKNPWFEATVVPTLQKQVHKILN